MVQAPSHTVCVHVCIWCGLEANRPVVVGGRLQRRSGPDWAFVGVHKGFSRHGMGLRRKAFVEASTSCLWPVGALLWTGPGTAPQVRLPAAGIIAALWTSNLLSVSWACLLILAGAFLKQSRPTTRP